MVDLNEERGRVAAVVPAAGQGTRLGAGVPKNLRKLGGVPILVHTVRALQAARSVEFVVVAAPPSQVAQTRASLAEHAADGQVRVVPGGATRQDSVRRALAAVPIEMGIVLVHDAARPFTPVPLIDAIVTTIHHGAHAVVPAIPLTDTVKQVDTQLRVTSTLDRSSLRAIQTPQGFRREVLEAAYAAVSSTELPDATDDAGLIEALGHAVLVVPGAFEAFKITHPFDLLVAEAVLAQRQMSAHAG